MKNTPDVFDVCVIGTGAGGGVMMDQLTAAGMKVVALERGPQLSPADFNEDELKILIRRQVFDKDKVETYRPNEKTPSEAGNHAQIAHCVGGSITHWGAWAWRFREDDFNVLSTDGPVAGANLADWPINYADLEPYYHKAEMDFGVAGVSGSNPFDAPRKNPYPNPPHPWRPSSHLFAKGAKKMGYTPFPIPLAINPRVYGNRPACMYGGACRGHGCPVYAKATTLSVSIPRALMTGNLDLRSGVAVYDIPVDKNGKATGAKYLDSDGKQHEVKAKQVIVAAGSLGTPQLLLMSKSAQFPDGLANSSGQVGKNLTFHHIPVIGAVFKEETRTVTGVEAMAAVDDEHPSDPKRGFIRGGMMSESNAASVQPLVFAAGLHSYTPGPKWGPEFKNKLREFPNTMAFSAICEDLPVESNRVDLDPDVKDKFGLPVPRVTKVQHANDIAMHKYFLDKLKQMAEAAGATKVYDVKMPDLYIDEKTSLKGSPHNHGTCRMGNDANTSVVNKWGQSHDVKNLWIADASVFPTSGGYNPTLTILANAYRIADYFIQQARSQSL